MNLIEHFYALFLSIVLGLSPDVALKRMNICSHDKIKPDADYVKVDEITEMIRLRDEEKLTYKQIGKFYGIIASTTHKRISRGRKFLEQQQTNSKL